MAPKKKEGKFAAKKKAKAAPAKEKNVEAKPSGSKAGVVFAILCVCVAILASVFFLDKLGIHIPLPGRTIAAGVTVADVDIGGLKRKEAIETVTAAIGDSYSTDTLVVTVLDKQMEITPADSGAVLDVKAAVKEAFKYGTEDNPETQVDIIPFLALNSDMIHGKINAFAANVPTDGIQTGSQMIKETIDGEERDVMELTLGTVYYDFNPDTLYSTILEAYKAHRFTANYTCNTFTAEAIDIDAVYAEHCIEPVDAVLDPQTHEVTQSVVGHRFDLEGAREALAAAKPGDVLKFPFEDVQPAMDTETLKSMLFRDVLGTYTAYQSSGSNRATNLRLACEALNGTILYPGDTFSYNDALGERTAEKGYKPAAAYMNGKTVQSYGGGICQPSSALYYCTLLADLEIVQRHCHTYPSSYVPFGLDATVSWGGPDFKFKNNTDFPILIDAAADGGSVTLTLVGTDVKDYYVKMDSEILRSISPKVEYIKVKAGSGHKDGEVKTSGHTGYEVQSYKLKYSRETDELISREKEAYSYYSTETRVVYKVIEEPKPTEPPASSTPDPEPTPDPPIGEAGSDVSIPGE